MNKKNKFSIFIFTLLFSATGMAYGMSLTKEDIQNIIDIYCTKIQIRKSYNNHWQTNVLDFYYENFFIGTSRYTLKNNKKIKLSLLRVYKIYQGLGIGEQLFYMTMRHIHKNNPEIELVFWTILFDNNENGLTIQEGYKKLFKFYRRVGSTVDESNKTAYINLKTAGYFDE